MSVKPSCTIQRRNSVPVHNPVEARLIPTIPGIKSFKVVTGLGERYEAGIISKTDQKTPFIIHDT
uniref:Uncharacterized protein n=1 Tax=Thermosphaera aggregans TaxID=54254 RepID=A0A7C2BKW7_9CREN